MARIFLASRFSNRFFLRERARELQAFGHIISSSWIYDAGEDPGKSYERYASHWAKINTLDLEQSDCLILDNTRLGSNPPKGGKYFEEGYMAGRGCPIFIVGTRERIIYHYHPAAVHYTCWKECLEYFKHLEYHPPGTIITRIKFDEGASETLDDRHLEQHPTV